MRRSFLGNGKILWVGTGRTGVKSWPSAGRELTSVHKGWFGGIIICLKNVCCVEVKSVKSQGQPTDEMK